MVKRQHADRRLENKTLSNEQFYSELAFASCETNDRDSTCNYESGFSVPMRYPMSDFERLLVPGCTELPACRCGKEMHIARTKSLAGKSDTHIRVYDCPACHHEMRLTVWGANPLT
jgi:hypothetical protein